MKKKIIKWIAKIMNWCEHDWDLGIKNGMIHKFCHKCNKTINTGI